MPSLRLTDTEAADVTAYLMTLQKPHFMKTAVRPPDPKAVHDLAKSYLIGSYPLRTDTSGKMSGLLVSVEEYDLGLDWPDRFKAGISRVTAADVKRVAITYMNPATFSSVIVGK